VEYGQKLQGKQIIKSSKSKMAAVCYGPNFLLKYLFVIGSVTRSFTLP